MLDDTWTMVVKRRVVPILAAHAPSCSRLFFALLALVVLSIGVVRPSVAAIAYVQGTSANSNSSGLLTKAYASAQLAGDLNVVIISWQDAVSTVSSVTDSKGNTYVAAFARTVDPGTVSEQIYYAKNIASATAGSNTVTVTFSTTVPFPEIRIVEYSGIDTVNPFDVGVGAYGTGATQNSGSLTTTSANEVLVASNDLSGGSTAAGTGYTQRFVTPVNELVEDKIVTSAGAYSATSTQSGTSWWVIQVAAFRAATGGDTTPPTGPTGLTATVAASTQINLSWTASTDNVGVTGYRVESCSGASCTTFAQIGTPTTTTYSATGLTASTSYSFRVRATDAAGNLSTYSSTASGTTSAAADTTPPTAPTGLTATVASSTQINLSWTASTDNVAVTGYRVESCSGASCTTFAQIGTPTTTTYSATGLAASTSYSFRVRANDAAGNLSTYSSTASTTTSAAPDTTPPTAPGTPTLTVVSPSQINLSWTASTDNVGVTGYRVESCSGASCTTFAQIGTPTTTTYSATGLTASTSYSFRVRANDAAGNLSSYSGTATASTSAAPSIAYVQGTSANASSAGLLTKAYASAQLAGDLNVVIISWQDAVSTVSSVTDSKGNTYVAAFARTVDPGTVSEQIYYAKNIASATAGSNTVTLTFSTTVPYPEIRILEYSGIDTVNPFDVGVGGYGTGATQNSGSLTTTSANEVLVASNDLSGGSTAAGTGYTQRFVTPVNELVEDKIVTTTGTYSATSTQSGTSWWVIQVAAFRAASGGDTTPPTAPGTPTPTVVSSSQINLSWTASTDNLGVTGYRVESCSGASCTSFAQIGTSTTTTYSATGLTASTPYMFRIRATDAAGNLSTYSTTASATTSAGTDTTPPTAPTGLTPSVVSSTQINLSWTASTDNVGVTGYRVESCSGASCTTFAQVGTPTTLTYSATGLTASTSYSFRVRATDAAGNLSAYSTTASVTTSAAADTAPPTVPGTPTPNVISATQINLAWAASTDNVGVTGYRVESCSGASCTTFAQIGTPTTTIYSATALTASTSYSFRIRATDAAGNLSSYSATASATTSAAPDTTPPTAPGTPTLTVVGSNQISLAWAASTDNVSVTGYLAESCNGAGCSTFTQIGSPTTTSYSNTGLTASTSYSYRVRATDAAGNLSGYSGVASATTTNGLNTYGYDAKGRLYSVAAAGGTLYYHYDAAGNVTSITTTP